MFSSGLAETYPTTYQQLGLSQHLLQPQETDMEIVVVEYTSLE
jgi:hypothetical protein